MGTTAQGLRYPEGTDRLNLVHTWIKNLADDVTTWINAAVPRFVGYQTADFTGFTSNGYIAIATIQDDYRTVFAVPSNSNRRVTIPQTGLYRVSAQCRLTRTAVNTATQNLRIAVNANGDTAAGQTVAIAFGTGDLDLSLSTGTRLYSFTSGDTVELFVQGLTGTTLKAGVGVSFLCIERVKP